MLLLESPVYLPLTLSSVHEVPPWGPVFSCLCVLTDKPSAWCRSAIKVKRWHTQALILKNLKTQANARVVLEPLCIHLYTESLTQD